MAIEIRNTATDRELNWLDTPELLGQLQIGLRNVATHEDWPGRSKTATPWIELVQRIYQILEARQVDPSAELKKLSEETGRLMDSLFRETLQWPAVIPRVRDLD